MPSSRRSTPPSAIPPAPLAAGVPPGGVTPGGRVAAGDRHRHLSRRRRGRWSGCACTTASPPSRCSRRCGPTDGRVVAVDRGYVTARERGGGAGLRRAAGGRGDARGPAARRRDRPRPPARRSPPTGTASSTSPTRRTLAAATGLPISARLPRADRGPARGARAAAGRPGGGAERGTVHQLLLRPAVADVRRDRRVRPRLLRAPGDAAAPRRADAPARRASPAVPPCAGSWRATTTVRPRTASGDGRLVGILGAPHPPRRCHVHLAGRPGHATRTPSLRRRDPRPPTRPGRRSRSSVAWRVRDGVDGDGQEQRVSGTPRKFG